MERTVLLGKQSVLYKETKCLVKGNSLFYLVYYLE